MLKNGPQNLAQVPSYQAQLLPILHCLSHPFDSDSSQVPPRNPFQGTHIGALAPLTIEVDCPNILQQCPPVCGLHRRAQASVPRTERLVHAVQGVGNGIHRVNHKLHLPLLLVARVSADAFLTCPRDAQRKCAWPPMPNLASHLLPCLSGLPGQLLPVHLRVELSDWIPELVSLQLKFSSQNSANQMFRRLFSRERVMKYWSNPDRRGRRVATI